jgi:hypothetical protein
VPRTGVHPNSSMSEIYWEKREADLSETIR